MARSKNPVDRRPRRSTQQENADRVHPISSKRKRRAEQQPPISSTAPTTSSSTPDTSSQPTTDIGAPEDLSLLPSYKFHIASKIWSGEEPRGPLDCHNRHQSLSLWPLVEECQ